MLILGQLQQIGDPHPFPPAATVRWPCPPGDKATDVSRHWITKEITYMTSVSALKKLKGEDRCQ